MPVKEEQNPNKETVTFKCDPSLKSRLTNDAKQLGISLSEYTAGIISSYYNPEKLNEKQETKTDIKQMAGSKDIKPCFDKFEGKLRDVLVQEVSSMIVSIDEIKELLLSNETFKNFKDTSEKLLSLTAKNESLTKQLEVPSPDTKTT